MKILKALELDKYSDNTRYTPHDGFVYEDATGGVGGKMGITTGTVYCVTLYAELEEGEDTQYPLEDLLDKYYVNCTEVMEEKEVDGKRIYIFEIEGEDAESIKNIAGLVGKRVYNYEDGAYIKLGISEEEKAKKKLVITRKKKFAGALLPYWVITGTSKENFMQTYRMDGDICGDVNGVPVSRIGIEELDKLGSRIDNGQTIEIEVPADVTNLFVSTMDGCLSNEINIDEYLIAGKSIIISTAGGFRKLSGPVIEG